MVDDKTSKMQSTVDGQTKRQCRGTSCCRCGGVHIGKRMSMQATWDGIRKATPSRIRVWSECYCHLHSERFRNVALRRKDFRRRYEPFAEVRSELDNLLQVDHCFVDARRLDSLCKKNETTTTTTTNQTKKKRKTNARSTATTATATNDKRQRGESRVQAVPQ